MPVESAAQPPSPTLSFVVICYNSAQMIETCLDHLCLAIEQSQWDGIEVIVVDDGSTDGTADVVTRFVATTPIRIRVHQQTNQGRLAASRAGARLAEGDLVSFIGERVWMQPNSLTNLRRLLVEHPEAQVWNCHIDIPRENNTQAQFWYVLTYLGWRRYLAEPRLVDFGLDDFDYYPKGTGGFVCPRDLLLAGYDELTSLYADEKNSSDDTALIRWIAARERIWMSPEYAADYISRDDRKGFFQHSFQRGTLLLDSYLRPGTRLFAPLIAFFLLFPAAVAAALRWPRLLLTIPAGWLAAVVGLRVQGVKARDLVGFSLWAPVFGVVFSAGMWRGLAAIVRQVVRSPR